MSEISGITFKQSAAEKTIMDNKVNSFNKALSNKRVAKSELDKNDFLKILITQLTHQDPTEPMKDKEFVAQMAQFSTLEQMTNMSKNFSKLSDLMSTGKAVSMVSLIGKTVEILESGRRITGKVEAIKGRENPQFLVGSRYYDFSKIEEIKE